MIFCKEFLLSKIFNFRIKLYFLIKQLYFFTASPQPVPHEVILFSTSGRVERGGKMERGLGREGKGNNPLLFIYTAVDVRRDWNVICFQPLARGGSGLGGGDVWHFRLASANFWSAGAAVSKLLTYRRFNADIHKSTGYSTMIPRKTWVLQKFWPDLEISEAF